jgi:hypothetical protein
VDLNLNQAVDSEVTPVSDPESPSGIQIGETTSESISFLWQPPERPAAGLGKIVGYRVDSREADMDAEFETVIESTNQSFALVEDLQPSTSYEFRIAALYKGGKASPVSPPSEPVMTSSPPLPPGQVIAVKLIGTSSESVTLKWEVPPGNGAFIDGYKVDMLSSEPESTWTTPIELTVDPNPTVVVDGLDERYKYSFRVAAHNSEGYGDDSEQTPFIAPVTLFVPPDSRTGAVDGISVSLRSIQWNTFVAAPWRLSSDDSLAHRVDLGLTRQNGIRQWQGSQIHHANLDAARFKLVEVTEGWFGLQTAHHSFLSVSGRLYARQITCGQREPVVCLSDHEKFRIITQVKLNSNYTDDNSTFTCPSGSHILQSRSGSFLAVLPPTMETKEPALAIAPIASSSKICFSFDLVNPVVKPSNTTDTTRSDTAQCGAGHAQLKLHDRLVLCHRYGALGAPAEQLCFPGPGSALAVGESRMCFRVQVRLETPYKVDGGAHTLIYTSARKESRCSLVSNTTVVGNISRPERRLSCNVSSHTECMFGCHRTDVYLKGFGRKMYPCHFDRTELRKQTEIVKTAEKQVEEAQAQLKILLNSSSTDRSTVTKMKMGLNKQLVELHAHRRNLKVVKAESGAVPTSPDKLLFTQWKQGKQLMMSEPGSPDFPRQFCCYSSCLASRGPIPGLALQGTTPLESEPKWLKPSEAFFTKDAEHWTSSPGNLALIDGSDGTSWCTGPIGVGEHKYAVFDFFTKLTKIEKFGYTTAGSALNATDVPAVLSLERAHELIPNGGGGWIPVIQVQSNASLHSQEFSDFGETARYWRLVIKASHGVSDMCIKSVRFFGQRFNEYSPWIVEHPSEWLQQSASMF